MCIRDSTHIQYLIPALKAGKHVLCEKSITLNSEELARARKVADEKGVVLAEAMTLYQMCIRDNRRRCRWGYPREQIRF